MLCLVSFALGLFCVCLICLECAYKRYPCAVVVLLLFGNKNMVMSNSLDQKVKKLYAARSKREAELHAIHEDIFRCINNQSRRVKVERLVTKCNEAFMTVVDRNEDLIAFAGKTEASSALVLSLESYLEAMTTKNDKILTSATKLHQLC